jgi:hypothetical protein
MSGDSDICQWRSKQEPPRDSTLAHCDGTPPFESCLCRQPFSGYPVTTGNEFQQRYGHRLFDSQEEVNSLLRVRHIR